MKELLAFYVSGFWVWVGITIGIVIAGSVVADILRVFFNFIVRLIRGDTQHICHCETTEKKEEIKKEEPGFTAFAGATATADLEVKVTRRIGKSSRRTRRNLL